MGILSWPLPHPPPTTPGSAHPAGVLASVPRLAASQSLVLSPSEVSMPGPGPRGYWRQSWAHIPLTSRHCPEFLWPRHSSQAAPQLRRVVTHFLSS